MSGMKPRKAARNARQKRRTAAGEGDGKGRGKKRAPVAAADRRNRTPLSLKEEFISLRAQGVAFKKVGEKLGVGKSTLILWGKELKEEIANAHALELEVLREKFFLSTERRIELFGGELARMKKELACRDYKDVPTAVLVKLLLETYEALSGEDVPPVLRSPDEIEQDRAAELVMMRLTAGSFPRLAAPGPDR